MRTLITLTLLAAGTLAASTTTGASVTTNYQLTPASMIVTCRQDDPTATQCIADPYAAAMASATGSGFSIGGYARDGQFENATYDATAFSQTTIGFTIETALTQVVGRYNLSISMQVPYLSGAMIAITQGSTSSTGNYFTNQTISVQSAYTPGTVITQKVNISGEVGSPGDDFVIADLRFAGFYDLSGNPLVAVDPDPTEAPEPASLGMIGAGLLAIGLRRKIATLKA